MTALNKNLTAIFVSVVAVSLGGAFTMFQSEEPATGTKSDSSKVLGHFEFVLKDKDGNVVAYRQTDNKIVNNGLNFTANRLFGTTLTVSHASTAYFQYIGVGSSNTAAAATQTDLVTQIGNHRLATVTNVGSNVGDPGIGAKLVATFGPGKITNSSGGTTIQESGIFDGFNSTNLYARQTFSSISVGPSDSLTVTWTVVFTSGT